MGNLKALLALTGATGALVSGAVVAFLSVGSVIAYEAGMVDVQFQALHIGTKQDAETPRTVAVEPDGSNPKEVVGGPVISSPVGLAALNPRSVAKQQPVERVDDGNSGAATTVVEIVQTGPKPGFGGDTVFQLPPGPAAPSPSSADKPKKKDPPPPPISSTGGVPPLGYDPDAEPGDDGSVDPDAGDDTTPPTSTPLPPAAAKYQATADKYAAKAQEQLDLIASDPANADKYQKAYEEYAAKSAKYAQMAQDKAAEIAASQQASATTLRKNKPGKSRKGGKSGKPSQAADGSFSTDGAPRPGVPVAVLPDVSDLEKDGKGKPDPESSGSPDAGSEAAAPVADCSRSIDQGGGTWGQAWLLYDPCDTVDAHAGEDDGADDKKDSGGSVLVDAGKDKSNKTRECVIEWELVTPANGDEPFWHATDSCDGKSSADPSATSTDQTVEVSPNPDYIDTGTSSVGGSSGGSGSSQGGSQGTAAPGKAPGKAPITVGGGAPSAP